MTRQVPNEQAIRKHTRELLKRAGINGEFPTPVDHIIAVVGLREPTESLLSGLVIGEAPEHLRRALRKIIPGRVRAILDRKEREIHVDPTIHNKGRLAFNRLHEVAHEIFPWQTELGYADDDATLAPSVKDLFEQEANIGASNLLFQHETFNSLANEFAISHASILALSQIVGASGHATFRRFVQSDKRIVAGIVMELEPCSWDPLAYRRREVLVSKKWATQFGSPASWPRILRPQPYSFVNLAESARLSKTVVQTEITLPNLQNEMVSLRVEIYSNQHHLFVLIGRYGKQRLKRHRIIVP